MNKANINEIALRVAKERYVAQHGGTGEGINFTNYAEFTHALLAELAKVQEPVAIVDDAGVIIVCSYSYKPGDKLFTHPAPSVPEWQPIETAPKTGCHLAFDTRFHSHPFVILWLDADHPSADGSGWYEHWDFNPVEPTHWMPLPKPPSARSE